jgi:hypothetical protein
MEVVVGTSMQRVRSLAGGILFTVWFAMVGVLGAYLMASHLLTIPAPAAAASIADGNWRAEHYIAADCPCSGAVATSLLQRAPEPSMHEHVTIIGSDPAMENALRSAGYIVGQLDRETLNATSSVQGAPWLMVYGPEGKVSYSGGYSMRRPGRGTAIEDQRIFAALRSGESVDSLPAYGCAMSRELRALTDPLGLKYR